MVGTRLALIAAALLFTSCHGKSTTKADAGPPPAPPEASAPPASDAATASAASASEGPGGAFADWLRARLPAGGAVKQGNGGTLAVVHTVAPGDTALTIATAYLDLTDVYMAKDLATEIDKEGALTPGAQVEIPHLLPAPYKSPKEDRLGWPPERALKGVFLTGAFAKLFWIQTLDRLAARKLNAVVLDTKDYMGPVDYPSKAKVAIETEAAKDPPIPDLARAMRFAHARGIRVIARIACFHDPWTAGRAPRLSVQGNWGKAFPLGWLDPANTEAQDYMLELVAEAIEAGTDEVQLDYVRFPVQPQSIKSAVLPPAHERAKVMDAFVKRVHEITKAHDVPLSLDIFGVTATGDQSDIDLLGQEIGVIGADAEALSPMVYPSHYASGFHGFDVPGDHPEIIGIGTRAAIAKLERAHIKSAVIRPWLQASSYKSPAFGPKYIVDEVKSAEAAGSVGWLMWDPGNSYWAVWRGIPPVNP